MGFERLSGSMTNNFATLSESKLFAHSHDIAWTKQSVKFCKCKFVNCFFFGSLRVNHHLGK